MSSKGRTTPLPLPWEQSQFSFLNREKDDGINEARRSHNGDARSEAGKSTTNLRRGNNGRTRFEVGSNTTDPQLNDDGGARYEIDNDPQINGNGGTDFAINSIKVTDYYLCRNPCFISKRKDSEYRNGVPSSTIR